MFLDSIFQFWKKKSIEEKNTWGFQPDDAAINAKNYFLKKKVQTILILGIGYGRNTKVFLENKIEAKCIEISQSAIKQELGKYGLVEFRKINEPTKHIKDEIPIKCCLIICQR